MIPSPHSRGNIMIVDDTRENLDLLANMFGDQGYTVRPFPSGKLALRAARHSPPDLILLDINMPEMNGYEVCEELQKDENLKKIPVIFISALSDTGNKIMAFKAGGVDYVNKPFQFEEVQARVETHLALRRLRLQLEEKNQVLQEGLARERKLERIKDQLVQMIVHDLRNPLASILGNVLYVEEVLPEGTDEANAVLDAVGSARRMRRMVSNILDVMQLEEHHLTPHRTMVALDTVIGEAVGTISVAAKRKGCSIIVESERTLPLVSIDADLVQRMVENLLENALKYSPKESSIKVTLDVSKQLEARIGIYDEGPGIPKEKYDQVFEVYHRLDDSFKDGFRKSSGLGLAFCKMAAECQGGRIWIEENKPGGAIFRIRIPGRPANNG